MAITTRTSALRRSTRFCTSCGAAAGGERFCGSCGHPLAPVVDLDDVVQVPRQSAPSDADDSPTVELAVDSIADEVLGVDEAGHVVAEGVHVEPGTGTPRRRRLLAGGAVLLVLVLLAGGVLLTRYLGDGDLRHALDSSTPVFNSAVEQMATSSTAEQVSQAAVGAGDAADDVEAALRRLGSVDDGKGTAVRNQLAAELALLQSLAALDGVDRTPMATWGGSHAALAAAVAQEGTSRSALRQHAAGTVDELADTGHMMSRVTAAVGASLVADATEESTRLLKALDAAATTGDLRKLGGAAAPERAAVAAAADALPDGDGKQVLLGYAAALTALVDLGKVDAEHTGGWSSNRAALATSFGELAAAAGSTGGAGVRVVLDQALASADGVVARAAAAIADWKAKTEAAVKDRVADGEALDSYASFFRSETKTYEQLREDLSAFTDRVEDPAADVTYYEGYATLSQAAQDRRDVRDLLVGTDVPEGVRAAHQEVVASISRAVAAVQSAYDGLEQSQDCWEGCPYYRDTPGWQRFLSESDGISANYSAALERWETAVAAQKSAIENRKLPAKPEL